MEEPRYGGLVDKYWWASILLTLLVILVIVGIFYLVISKGFAVENFKSACESFGGNFYELQNTSCKLGHEDCLFNCNLNGKNYNLDDLGISFSYSKYFCVEDCSYENSKSNDGMMRCVC